MFRKTLISMGIDISIDELLTFTGKSSKMIVDEIINRYDSNYL